MQYCRFILIPEHLWEIIPIKSELQFKSKGKGKSSGDRVITYVVTEDQEVYLLTIYDKSEFDTLDDKMIKVIIENLKNG